MEEKILYTTAKPVLSLARLRFRFALLKWLVPAGLMLLTIAYQLGPAPWIHENLGFRYHQIIETVLFATIGPVLAFLVLSFVERWLEEKDTSDLQAQIIAQAREDMRTSRQLSDDALQVLFSAGALITSLKVTQGEPSPETAAQIEQTQQALNEAAERLRSHLLT